MQTIELVGEESGKVDILILLLQTGIYIYRFCTLAGFNLS